MIDPLVIATSIAKRIPLVPMRQTQTRRDARDNFLRCEGKSCERQVGMVGVGSEVCGNVAARVAACARREELGGLRATTPEGQGVVGLSAAQHGASSGGNQMRNVA